MSIDNWMSFYEENMNNKNFLSLYFNLITTPFQNINYIICRCGKCINCRSNDTLSYHLNNKISCDNQRICYNCGKQKNILTNYYPSSIHSSLDIFNDNDFYCYFLLKQFLINLFIFLISFIMIPIQTIIYFLYVCSILTKSTLYLIYKHKYQDRDLDLEREDYIYDEFDYKIIKYVKFLFFQVYGSYISYGYDFIIFILFITITKYIGNGNGNGYIIIFIILYILINRFVNILVFVSLSFIGLPGIILHVITTICDFFIIQLNQCVINRILDNCGFPIVSSPCSKNKIILFQNISVKYISFKIIFIITHSLYHMFIGIIQCFVLFPFSIE